jgi:hypothetical protein
MSQMSSEGGGGGGGNVFTRKVGPLPMWAWMGIALLIAVGYYLIKKKASGNTSGAGSSPSTVNTPGGVDSSLVPQFVNQTFVQDSPPSAPAVPTPPPATTPPPVTNPNLPLNEILQQGHVINPSAKKAVIGWTIKQKSPNATQLLVQLDGPGQKNFQRFIPATATTATFDNLQAGHTYVANVTPMDAQGQAVGGPNHITFVTK